MQKFKKLWLDCLFLGIREAQDMGWCYLYISHADGWEGRDDISLSEAVHDSSHGVSFLFSREEIKVAAEHEARELMEQLNGVIKAVGDTDRYIFWTSDAAQITPETTCGIGMNAEASQITIGLKKQLAPELFCVLFNGGRMAWQENAFVFLKDSRTPVCFEGNRALSMSSVNEARIHFSGLQMGCVSWKCYLRRKELNEKVTPSFRYLYTKDESLCRSLFSFWNQEHVTEEVSDGFCVSMDFTDVYNQYAERRIKEDEKTALEQYSEKRSFFSFLGWNNKGNATVIKSYFQTIYGKAVYLTPRGWQEKGGYGGRFVFVPQGEEGSWLEPDGDFLLTAEAEASENGEAKEICLLCGLSGTEYIRMWEGDTMRFCSGMPSYAAHYPVHAASTVGKPVDLSASLLDDRYTTSWLAIKGEKAPEYAAQPRGSAYYGKGENSSNEENGMLCHDLTGIAMNRAENLLFPCAPYAGLADGIQDTVADYENTILSVARKNCIAASLSETLQRMEEKMRERLEKGGGEEEDSIVTTSGGQLVTKSKEGIWKEVMFANNQLKDCLHRLYLEQPQRLIQQTMESSSLFFVVANCDYLGELTGEQNDIGRQAFHNTINIEDWMFTVNPGKGSEYNEYRNIMIVKGRKGKLYEPSSKKNKEEQPQSLLANPSLWTNGEKFAAPWSENAGAGDADQMVNLATWLVQYCKNAYENRENEYFKEFCKIIQDPEWQGVLFLNVSIDAQSVPVGLQGLLAGISGAAQICLHHLSIKSSHVAFSGGSLKQDGSSSLSGLIYFQDPAFDGKTAVLPGNGDFEFRLLELKVLFESSAVKKFESYAQLTVNQLFGLKVTSMGQEKTDNHSILLSGVYQNDSGSPSYHLKSISDSTCFFEESFVNAVTIRNVNLTTVDADAKKYSFLLDGCIDFAIPGAWGADLFSFGSEDKQSGGLEFQELAINMKGSGAGQELSMETEQLAFDIDKSLLRKHSLYDSMSLQLEGMICGKEGKQPSDFGYLNVTTEFATDQPGESWYGFVFGLNMGSLGELAQKAGIVSKLLIAFSGNEAGKEGQRVSVGIKLPGSGKKDFLSLQNMLSLSVEQIWLMYDKEKQSFFLIFDDIALKLFGLMSIPPSGSTMFYVFGDCSKTGESKELGWYAVYRKEEKQTEKESGKGGSIWE